MTTAFLFAAATLLPAAGPDDAASVTPERVAALIDGLSAASRAERALAERALVALGPAALDLLPAPESPAAPTGAAALAALERVRTALAAAPEPPAGPVRLPVDSLPRGTLAETLTAVAKRTGNRLDLSAVPPETLSAPTPTLLATTEAEAGVTFWELIAAFAPGRFAIGEIEDGALRLLPPAVDAAALFGSATSDGGVRIEFGRVTERSRFGADGVLWRLPVRMLAEPRLRPLSARPLAGGLTATAGETPLEPFNPAASREIGFTEGAASFTVDFLPPPADDETGVPRTVAVDAAYELTAIPGDRSFEFAGTAVGESRSAGGATVRLDRFERMETGVTIAAAVLYDADDGGPAFESYQTWRYDVRVSLTGPNDATLEPLAAPRIVSEGAAAVAVLARFHVPPDADRSQYRVEIVAPAAPVTSKVRFEGLTTSVPR